MTVMGVTYERGFSADANAMLLFTIPDDMDVVRFTALAAADDSGINQTGATTSICFMVFDCNPLVSESDDYEARSGLISRDGTKSCTLTANVEGASQLKIVVSNWGDGFSYDRADLINPVLIDADGNETSLTTLTPTSYTSQWGSLHTNQNVEGGTLKVEGQAYDTGLGLNAECTLIYDLPAGHTYVTFQALCGYDSSCDTDNTSSDGTTMEFIIYVEQSTLTTVDLTQFGYASDQSIAVYDCWAKEDLSPVQGSFSAEVPSHGALLLKLTPERNATSSVTLTCNEDSTQLIATASPADGQQSYIQLLCDGQVIGNMSLSDDGTAAYTLSAEWNAGEHTYQALYSGTATASASASAELTLTLTTDEGDDSEDEDVKTGIAPVGSPQAKGQAYDLSGRRLPKNHKGIYIQDGKKHIK